MPICLFRPPADSDEDCGDCKSAVGRLRWREIGLLPIVNDEGGNFFYERISMIIGDEEVYEARMARW